VIDLLGTAELFQAAAVQHSHPIGDHERFLMIVGDEDGGRFQVT
jgi:hypothetical protein